MKTNKVETVEAEEPTSTLVGYKIKHVKGGIIYIQEKEMNFRIEPGTTYGRVFSEEEIAKSHEVNKFLELGMLELLECYAEKGKKFAKPHTKVEEANNVMIKKFDGGKLPEGVIIQDGIIISENPEGNAPKYIVGDWVYILSNASLKGEIVGKSEKMGGRLEIRLEDGRRAFAYDSEIGPLNMPMASTPNEIISLEVGKRVLNAGDVLKRNVVSNPSKENPSVLSASNVINASARGTNLQGKPLNEGTRPGVHFSAQEILTRPPSNELPEIIKENRVIISEGGAETQSEDGDEGMIIVGKGPGKAQTVNISKVLSDSVTVANQNLVQETKKIISKEDKKKERKRKRANKKLIDVNLSEEIKKFLANPFHLQKFGISRMKDTDKILKIANATNNEELILICEQRLQQLGVSK